MVFTMINLVKAYLGAGFLFVSIVIINVFQTISLLVFPFSRKLFRSINRFFAKTWWSWCEWTVVKWCKVKISITGDEIPEKENAIIICNHQTMTDIPMLFTIAKKAKRLGDLKWFVKDSLKYAPGVGWGMLFLDCLFVKRNWHSDKDNIEATFKKFFKEDIPIWLMIFPEGTRFKKSKLERSHKIALRKGLPILNNVLLPRPKGFTSSVVGLKGHVSAVYDISINYFGSSPSLWELFKSSLKKVEVNIVRYPIESLPADEKDLSNWIVERFKEKDQFLA